MSKVKQGNVVLKQNQSLEIGQKALTYALLELLTNLSIQNGELYYRNIPVINLSNIQKDLLPDRTITRSIGAPNKQWKDIHIGPGPIYLNNKELVINTLAELILQSSQDQNLKLRSKGNSAIILSSDNFTYVENDLRVENNILVQDKQVAVLNNDGDLPIENIPDTIYPNVYSVNTLTQMNILPNIKKGDFCIVVEEEDTYVYNGTQWIKFLFSLEGPLFEQHDVIFGGTSSI